MLSKELHCILLAFSEFLSLVVSLFYTWQEKESGAPGVLAVNLPLPWLCPVGAERWLTGVRKKPAIKRSGKTASAHSQSHLRGQRSRPQGCSHPEPVTPPRFGVPLLGYYFM